MQQRPLADRSAKTDINTVPTKIFQCHLQINTTLPDSSTQQLLTMDINEGIILEGLKQKCDSCIFIKALLIIPKKYALFELCNV